jgi:hypothetical protein
LKIEADLLNGPQGHLT